ncbi:MAG: DUF4846 domain-containing protein [Planctomycetes bacterium]|nr:DUF4846 domain-containing protein [Planctomycetota bacterium]
MADALKNMPVLALALVAAFMWVQRLREAESGESPESGGVVSPSYGWLGPEGAYPGYPWLDQEPDPAASLHRRFSPPAGFARKPVPAGSFGEWLRCLPLRPGRGVVRLFDGSEKSDQGSHAAVIDIETGDSDLQQCADSILRLRAEYLWFLGRSEAIRFRFTSGDLAPYEDWRLGFRPVVTGAAVSWLRQEPRDDSYASFRLYLDRLFTYAGTLSLERDLSAVGSIDDLEVGDVWVRGGSPGHAVLVVDMVEHLRTGEKAFLLAQGYMPAQDIHVLARPGGDGDPWFRFPDDGVLATGSWSFEARHLRRF